MVASELLTLFAGAFSSVLCGFCECRPAPRTGALPVLLIHGSGFNQSEWLPLRAYLATDPRIGPTYTVNFGGLCWHDKSSSIHDIAVDCIMPVLELMFRDTSARKAVLVGHSLGGLIAAEVAENVAKSGEIVKVITICSPFLGAPIMEHALKVCPSKETDQQMRVGSPYLQAVCAGILHKDAQGKGTIYYQIGSRMDVIVPASHAVLPLSHEQRRRVYNGPEGHYSVVLSPRVWRQVCEWILD
jgi:pimeloyl-ACP methyl ester carboxylesterase